MENISMKEKSICEIDSDGNKRWRLNGKTHREGNLPAVIWADGDKYWYINGELHRTDGPAVCEYDYDAWYLNGKRISCKTQEEFEYYIKYKAFL